MENKIKTMYLDTIKEKSRLFPVPFNSEMVNAILEGRKTEMRQLIKPQPTFSPAAGFSWKGYAYGIDFPPTMIGASNNFICAAPYQPGDILYVKEAWRVRAWDIRKQLIAINYQDGTCGELTYIKDRLLFERIVNQAREDARKAKCECDGADFARKMDNSPCRWQLPDHMPEEAARIFLMVTKVCVSRLQYITEKQVFREGVDVINGLHRGYTDGIEMYKEIWDAAISKADKECYGWEASPWVWVTEFKRIGSPIRDE